MNMKKLILILTLAVMTVAGVQNASAQSIPPYTKTGTDAVGEMIPVWNTTDSLIVDGSVVSIDTSSVVKRIGVRNYIPGASLRMRALGIAVGDIKRSSQGGAGKVLLKGYHPRALIGASGTAAGNSLKMSLTVNGSFAIADTVSGVVGYVLGGNSGTYSGVRYKYKVWFWGVRNVGGATL